MERREEVGKDYPILTFADILRALKEHPDWLEELRKLILTAELLELPKKVDELLKRVEKLEQDVEILKHDVEILKHDVEILKQDVEILKQDVEILKHDVEILKQDVAILKQDVEQLKKDVNYLKGEFGKFKGSDFERKIRDKYYAYFGRLLKKAKILHMEKLIDLIDEAEDKREISETERDYLFELDLVVKGKIRKTGKEVVLAVEISYSLYPEDVERAKKRAEILRKVLKTEVIPTVVYVEAKKELKDEEVLFISAKY